MTDLNEAIVPLEVDISKSTTPENPDIYLMHIKGKSLSEGEWSSEKEVLLLWQRDALIEALSEIGVAVNELGSEDG